MEIIEVHPGNDNVFVKKAGTAHDDEGGAVAAVVREISASRKVGNGAGRKRNRKLLMAELRKRKKVVGGE